MMTPKIGQVCLVFTTDFLVVETHWLPCCFARRDMVKHVYAWPGTSGGETGMIAVIFLPISGGFRNQ
jgi:hypothetical protein